MFMVFIRDVIWPRAKPDGPTMQEWCRSFHSDFVPGLEAARVEVLPTSRPNKDFWHLIDKTAEIGARCEVIGRDPKTNKKVAIHADWSMTAIRRFWQHPAPDGVSMMWPGFLMRLMVKGEWGLAE